MWKLILIHFLKTNSFLFLQLSEGDTFYYNHLHKFLIIFRCCENKAEREAADASSKSAKSNPGATVQPTKQNELPGAGVLANQQLAGTTY